MSAVLTLSAPNSRITGDAINFVVNKGASNNSCDSTGFVVPYAHSAITPERLRIDDPSGVMKDAKETVVDGAPAKSFFGYNDRMGDTREVWFIKNGYLYEVTTYKPLAAWLTEILQTWKYL